MIASLEMPPLYVEGQSDKHTIIQLLGRHGISLDASAGPVIVKDSKNDEGVLKAMSTAAKASTRLPVGFVLDADDSVSSRWQAVCQRLSELKLDLPGKIPREGFVAESSVNQSRIGVWIMPDNQMDTGALEHFVHTLVPCGDPLFAFAQASTEGALEHQAKFKAQDRTKAELHCWLAWQSKPGLPLGTAIKAKYFEHDSELANRFVEWFKKLFCDSLREIA